jgi:hypothetical protein
MFGSFLRAYGRYATKVYSGRGADIVMQSSGVLGLGTCPVTAFLSGLKLLVPVLPTARPEPHGVLSKYSPCRNLSGLSVYIPIPEAPNCLLSEAVSRSDSWLPKYSLDSKAA